MTDIATSAGTVPEWTVGDRMRKSLSTAGISVQDMADYLDVSRMTVSTWINGRIEPRKQTLRLWALRTGVPLEWLELGESNPRPPRGGGDGPRGFVAFGASWGDRTPDLRFTGSEVQRADELADAA